jgi:hypothetical protein
MWGNPPATPFRRSDRVYLHIQKRRLRCACLPFHPELPMGNHSTPVLGDKITPLTRGGGLKGLRRLEQANASISPNLIRKNLEEGCPLQLNSRHDAGIQHKYVALLR